MAIQSVTSVVLEPAVLESCGEIIEDETPCVDEEEKMYVALGKDVKEGKSVLLWALQHLQGNKICILHVHKLAHMIPLLGGKFAPDKVEDEEVRAYRDLKKKKMHKVLTKYRKICSRVGVHAEFLEIEMDNIEEGILHLIVQHRVKKLVMGAAKDKHYTKKTATLSKKALFVNQEADASCHIWFVRNGCLVQTRAEGSLEGIEIQVSDPLVDGSIFATTQRSYLKSRSLTEGRNNHAKHRMVQAFTRQVSYSGERVTTLSSLDRRGAMLKLPGQLASEGGVDGLEGISRSPSTCSSSDKVLESFSSIHEEEEEVRVSRDMLDQLQQAVAEAENSVFQETLKHQKAEKDALEAISKAKEAERLYVNEVRQRKEIEEALIRETEIRNKIQGQLEEIVIKLRTALDQKAVLKIQIYDSDRVVKEFEEKILSAVELLISFKEQRDRLLLERDNALREAEELRKRCEKLTTSSQGQQLTSDISFLEIEEATCGFDPSLIIGVGGYGSVYKGFFHCTEVAIKLLQASSSQGDSEFQQEVDVLSRIRHPNLVTLIGACPEARSLVYEYLPNGSLEDRLICKDNTPALSWQKRVCIAAEVCSALIFLHSNKPHSIIHGDIKPANILLDANFVSKLGDFGICRLASNGNDSTDTTTPCCITNPKGTLVYMDPEFLRIGELSVKSDVYSFGIILLRLLTGRPPVGVVKEVQCALEKGNLSSILDETAGDWPFVQATELAHLALRCCDMNRKSRPYLDPEVWTILERMKVSSRASSSYHLGAEEENHKVCRVRRLSAEYLRLRDGRKEPKKHKNQTTRQKKGT